MQQESTESGDVRLLLINQRWLAPELKACGAEVFTVGWDNGTFDLNFAGPALPLEELLSLIAPSFRPTQLIYFDDSGPISVLGLERSELPVVFYSVDTHHHWIWHKAFAAAADLTLVAQLHYQSVFAGLDPVWFPLWAEPVSWAEARNVDVCFRGNLSSQLHPLRAAFFENVVQTVPVDLHNGPWQESYPRARIVLNQAVKDDLNFRVFEALASGALLVTPDHIRGLAELFEPGEDLVLYQNGNATDASEKVRYYLDHEEERRLIAENGAKKVLQHHSAEKRAKQLLELVKGLRRKPCAARFLHVALSYLMCTRLCLGHMPQAALRMLNAATELLFAETSVPEWALAEFETGVVSCSHFLKTLGAREVAFELVRQSAAKHPESSVLQIAEIERLLETGDAASASELASRISDTPDEILACAPTLLASVRHALTLGATGQGSTE